MTTEYIETQNDEHWKSLRVKDVTSTESAALFGLSPYITEMELFYRKKTGEVAEFTDNQRMRAGRLLEPAIANMVADELGCEVKPFKCYARNPERMGASFDFVITSGQYKDWILEIKNVDFLVYRDQWQDDEAPDHIEVQCQHQLELTARPGAIIACLIGGNDLRLIERHRNFKMGFGIRQRIERFWKDIEQNNQPEPNFERDADFIIGLYQSSGDKVESFDEGGLVSDLLHKYKDLRSVLSDTEKESKAIKAQLLTLIGEDSSKVLAGSYSLSCGMVAETEVEAYTRKGYRSFRVTEKKIKKEKK